MTAMLPLEIIRSLIHTPDVLFLDEPTQGLDAVSRRTLWEYINNVRKQYGTTVFLTTHYIDEAENVDKVCIINHGKIATCQSPDEMRQSLLRKDLILDADDRAGPDRRACRAEFAIQGKRAGCGDFCRANGAASYRKTENPIDGAENLRAVAGRRLCGILESIGRACFMNDEMVLSRRKSKVRRELGATFAVFAREVTLFFKSPSTIIMSLAMPLVMMGMIGGNLMENMAGGLSFSFGGFMLVGMLVNMLFMTTTIGMTSLVDDHETDFNQEMMVSPVSRYSLVIGKILGSSFGAIVSMLGTLIVGLIMGIALPVGQLLTVLALSPLMCLSGGALSMILIGLIKSKKAANYAVMLITMPQMFLSGAIIPIKSSTGVLKILSRCMPMTYCLDLVRAVVYHGSPEYDSVVMFNPLVNCVAIVGLTLACLVVGTYFFAKTEKNR